MPITQFPFPWFSLCLGLALLVARVGQGAPATASVAPIRRPNIVFIFSDDLTCQALSSYGDSRQLLQTPHMDRLAREGMRFDRCLVTNSICGPSRATILTGKYSHKNGFYNNSNCTFDGTQVTFPKLLQQAGYATAVIGKWHLGSPPTGFDHWQILPGQGIYYNPPMTRNGQKVTTEGYVTDIITDLSLEWLKQRDRERPFLLMCQHKAPHREWSPALRHLGWDGDRQHPRPDNLFDPLKGRSRAVREHDMGLDRTFTDLDVKRKLPPGINPRQREAWDAHYGPRNRKLDVDAPTGDELVGWRYNRYMHDYLGCVKGVDESVGRLLQFLDDEGLTENTLVVCTSDQGFFLGEHGWFDKRWIFEESLRTPLLVRWPGVVKPGEVEPALVSLLDLPETFLQAAGVEVPAEMQGRSLMPVLAGERPADWRTSFYYHYYEFPQPHHVRPHRGVVTDRYKLVHYYGPDVDDWELLDRRVDPQEMRSFHDDPEYAKVVSDLKQELQRLRQQFDDTGDPPRRAFGNEAFESEKKQP